MNSELVRSLQTLTDCRALVVGDVMLDRYVWGSVERVSQEAPVLVLNDEEHESRLGGAANVARAVAALGPYVSVLGVVGEDDAGRETRALLGHYQIDCHRLVSSSGCGTTVKQRFVGKAAGRHAHQILRVDTECAKEFDVGLLSRLAACIPDAVEQHDVILISDYGKGVCAESLVTALIAESRKSGKPVLVDPALGRAIDAYALASVVCPNRREAEQVTGKRIVDQEDALTAGRSLVSRLQLNVGAVLTLDRDGMAVVDKRGTARLLQADVRHVYDITGAGDIVLAVLGVAIASGHSLHTAAELANFAAGISVEKLGAAPVSIAEIRARAVGSLSTEEKVVKLKDLVNVASGHREQGRTIAFTNGCYDLLHVGHVRCLQEAAAAADILIVGVNSDESVRRLKGGARPIIPLADRLALVSALACVDYILVIHDESPCRILRRVRPDVLVKGGDYESVADVVGREIVEAYGGRVRLTRPVNGVSTSQIVAKLVRQRRNTVLTGV